MENATKALLIGAGLLIGVMILSLGVALYASLQGYISTHQDEMDFNEINQFNTKFIQYINYIDGVKKFDLTIQDIITVANIAQQNNQENFLDETNRENPRTSYVAVYLDNVPIESDIEVKSQQLLKDSLNSGIKRYKCTYNDVSFSDSTGRIYMIKFSEE